HIYLMFQNDAEMPGLDYYNAYEGGPDSVTGKIEEVNGRSYLILKRKWDDESTETVRLLINGGKFVEKGTKTVKSQSR
ncbi:MAG TPA: hypothetical protein VG733_11605, partial [Chthoniobacteraceae bacterium]|nr:hypothetical protein [Chthoniobacteraceae bacterium]